MFFPAPRQTPDWSVAIGHLRRDRALRRFIDAVGPCTLRPIGRPFDVLIRSIFAQQISTKIATTLYGRFAARFPRKAPTPARVVAALSGEWDDATIRHCGLSRQKRAYVLDLAQHFADRRIRARTLAAMDDERVIGALMQVNGIGRWTAEMFLIFVLNRPDVLPVDDLGLREGIKRLHGLADRPKPAEIREVAGAWAPWRSIATWYIWRGLSTKPPR